MQSSNLLHEKEQIVNLVDQQRTPVSASDLYRALRECIAKKDLSVGRRLHALIIRSGYELSSFWGSHVIRMYACLGSLVEANQVFRKLPAPTIFVWTSIISAHCYNGRAEQAIQLYHCMRQSSAAQPDNYLFVAVLKACAATANLAAGRLVHNHAGQVGLESDVFVGNALVDMYGKCGSATCARMLFDKLPSKNVVTWSAMIAAYAQNGLGREALKLYQAMRQDGVTPDRVAFISILKACGSIGDLQTGQEIHTHILQRKLETDLSVGNTLVDMYCKCGSLDYACRVFEAMPSRNAVTWNAMIAGYVHQGCGNQALQLFKDMPRHGIEPGSATFISVLKACGSVGAIIEGKHIHSQILEMGLSAGVPLHNAIIDMYAQSGSMEDARVVFDSLASKDVVTWNTMIAGYARNGLGQKALELYDAMQQGGIVPVTATFVSILKAVIKVGAAQAGIKIHGHIRDRGLEGETVLGSSLVDMYAKCGHPELAREVFDGLPNKTIVTWTAMVAGYTQHGFHNEALNLYKSLDQHEIVADNIMYLCVLKACSSIGAAQEGKRVHEQILGRGLSGDTLIGNALVDMYAKCGNLHDARQVFNELPSRDIVTWNSMIAGYVLQGDGEEALSLFSMMQQEDILADEVTLLSALSACSSIGAIQQGKDIHAQIVERGLENNLVVGSTLVDMYSKCGCLEDARDVFDRLSKRNVVTWTALIYGYGQHNECEMALQCFEDMLKDGIEPDGATFVSVLTACSHVGLVQEGKRYFSMMQDRYGIRPSVEHYNCMVDVLGRSGHLDEAEVLLQSMPCRHDSVGWLSLLTACRTSGNVDIGTRCFDRLAQMEPTEASAYVLMSDIYSDAGRWDDVGHIERLRRCAGAEKKPAKASIEVNSRLQEFIVGERRDDVSAKLKSLVVGVKQERRVPDEETDDALCGHAEKLALAFGLLNTPTGSTLLVTKNLRMCDFCHVGTKMISRIEGREIIVRDAHRIHHFKDGLCSCGDSH